MIIRNWRKTHTTQTKHTHTKLKQKLWPSHIFTFETSYSKSGQKFLLAQNNDLDGPLFVVVKKAGVRVLLLKIQIPMFANMQTLEFGF